MCLWHHCEHLSETALTKIQELDLLKNTHLKMVLIMGWNSYVEVQTPLPPNVTYQEMQSLCRGNQVKKRPTAGPRSNMTGSYKERKSDSRDKYTKRKETQGETDMDQPRREAWNRSGLVALRHQPYDTLILDP